MVVYARTYGASRINIRGLSECLRQIERVRTELVPRRLWRWLDAWGLRMETDVQGILRRGYGRSSGRLANSYTHEVGKTGGDRIELRVGTNTPYAKYVEGVPTIPRRHFLPFRGHKNFADWARRTLGLRPSQIDTSLPKPHSKRPPMGSGRKGAVRMSHFVTRQTNWRDKKKIRGLTVGGPKSIRPALLPSFNRNMPLMAQDAGRMLD